MEAQAKARFVRIAPRKARIIVDLIHGKNAAEAVEFLKFTPRSGAKIIGKVLGSAVANAQQKAAGVNVDALRVKEAFVDEGPAKFMRRWRPRAMGRATRITKKTSHITIVLES